MNFSNADKEALKNNTAIILSKVTLIETGEEFTEEDYLAGWTYEDFRYVPKTGFIGQFVERILDGNMVNLPSNITLENKEINLQIGIMRNALEDELDEDEDEDSKITTYYDYGNFIITKISDEDTTGNISFESSDYAKYFNKDYTGGTNFPCVALELADYVCNLAGVPLASNGSAYCHAVHKDGLPAGTYKFITGDDTVIEFDTSIDLNFYDSFIYSVEADTLFQRHVDSDFNVTKTIVPTRKVTSSTATELTFKVSSYQDFINNDFVIDSDQFDSEPTCRDVIKAIAQLAYGWARVGVDNKVHIDFRIKNESDVEDCNKFNGDEYYESTRSDMYYGPVNKVSIGMSTVDGETFYKTSPDYTPENECELQIWDNPLTYSEEARAIALNGCENVFGLTYLPLTIETIGHPWLEADDYIELTNTTGEVIYTYPFDRSITYAGYIKGTISSEANSSVEQEYEYESSVIKSMNSTRITVDKQNQSINLAVTTANDANTTASEAKVTAQGIETRVESTENELHGDDGNGGLKKEVSDVKQDIKSITNLFQITGGKNLIKNSAWLFTDNVWEFDSDEKQTMYHTELGNGYDGTLIGSVVSVARMRLKDCKMTSTADNIVGLINDTQYTLSYKYSNDDNTTLTINLKSTKTGGIIASRVYNSSAYMLEDTITFEAKEPNYYIEIISDTLLDGYSDIFDLMLNKGEAITWEPSNGEINSTILKMSQSGLQIISTGSDIATIMTAQGFSINQISGVGADISIGDVVTAFTNLGLTTKAAKTDSVQTGNFILEERTLDGYEHHLEYFKESERG